MAPSRVPLLALERTFYLNLEIACARVKKTKRHKILHEKISGLKSLNARLIALATRTSTCETW